MADIRVAVGFAVGGALAVLVAALVVKEMPVELLRWLVIVVAVYAATVMLRDAVRALRRGTSDNDDVALARVGQPKL